MRLSWEEKLCRKINVTKFNFSFYHFLCGKTVHLQNEKIGLMMNFGYVYIMTNKNKTTLYIGVLINQKNPEWKELVNERGFIRDRG